MGTLRMSMPAAAATAIIIKCASARDTRLSSARRRHLAQSRDPGRDHAFPRERNNPGQRTRRHRAIDRNGHHVRRVSIHRNIDLERYQRFFRDIGAHYRHCASSDSGR